MKAVVAAFNQEKALVGAFFVITNLRMELFEALVQTLTLQTAGTARQLGTGEKQDNWSLVLSMQVLSSIFNPHGTCVSISCVHWNIVLIELLHASYNLAYNKQNDWYLTLHWHVIRWDVESHWWLIGYQTTVCVPCPHNPVRCLVSCF